MENTYTHKVSRLAGALVASATLLPVASMAQELSFTQIAKIEQERLKVAVQNIDNKIIDARAAYVAGNYQNSVDLYKQAIGALPHGRIADSRREHLNQALSQASIELSKTQVRNGDVSGSRDTLNSVLQLDPTNAQANKALDETFNPIRVNPALTIEHGSNVEKVKHHLYIGEGYYNSGQFDKSLLEFDKVLRIDPYNRAARRYQSKVHEERARYARVAFDETRARLLTEVDLAWEIVPAPLTIAESGSSTGETVENPTIINQRKLDNIIIPRLDLQDIPLREAIDLLASIARDNDPNPNPLEKGVTFVVNTQQTSGEGGGIESSEIRVPSLQLQNVPLKEALKQICNLCTPTMRFKVEEYVVSIVPASDTSVTELLTKQFNVVPGFVERLGGTASGASGGGETGGLFGSDDSGDDAAPKSLKELVTQMGVKFPEGSSVQYVPVTSSVIVTNTAVGIDRIAKIIEDVNGQTPKMIKITSKFVEINQEDSDELGFDWVVSPFGLTDNSVFLGGGTSGNGTPRTSDNFAPTVNGNGISGIPTNGQNVSNTVTSGLRSGDTAITADSIDSFLNNPLRTSQQTSVAPGILTLTGLFSESQVQLVLRGVAQKRGSDIMNAPSVVARPGETARIEVVRQFIYPSEYDPPELPDNIGGGGAAGAAPGAVTVVPITPATPSAFEVVPTGVILEVTPQVGEGTNSKTISLQLEPEIVEFEGFINYGSPIQAIGTDALGNNIQITITENRIEQPVFSRRSISTQLTIYDGHTVSIGGLMSEEVQKVEDKVPILGDLPLIGRLFQSQSENRLKSNLVIFVTANIIDPTGKRLYSSTDISDDSAGGSSSVGLISSDLLPAPQL